MLRTSSQLAENLDSILAPYAVKHSFGKGRLNPEPTDKFRTRFQLDRDRILHSKPFRRLKNKTQVFTPSTGDHFRDRLTHTLEVSQIARSLARILSLNEDLAEVIALSHDLGHTPFGHAGEYALRDCMRQHGLDFEHNQQSLHLVMPLNLNLEVIEGLQKHQTPYDQATSSITSASLEAQIVNFADEIAYHNHDLDDGIRSGILAPADYSQLRLFAEAASALKIPNFDPIKHRAKVISKMMKMMIEDLAEQTQRNLDSLQIADLQAVYQAREKLVNFSLAFQPKVTELRTYLYQNFYHSLSVTTQTESGQQVITQLFDFYIKNPHQLPKKLQSKIVSHENSVNIIKDYISGMTDNYAKSKFKEYALS